MPAADERTIEELAHELGLPVSTIRLYQTRGLIPGPRREGRVAYYDNGHLARLRLLAQLQERGFSLAAIKELIDGMDAGQSLHTVLGLGAESSTWTPEDPQAMTIAELMQRLPNVEPTPELIQRIVGLGLVRLDDDGGVVVDSPSFLDIGGRLITMGVPSETVLDEYDALRTHTDQIAEQFTDVFREHFWRHFVESGMPADRITGLAATLEQLGPLAEAVVTVALRRSLQQSAEAFIVEQADELGIDLPRPGSTT